MWAIYGYDTDDAGEGSGEGSGYVSPFGDAWGGANDPGLGACCAECEQSGSVLCKYVKPYLPQILLGVGALLFFEVI